MRNMNPMEAMRESQVGIALTTVLATLAVGAANAQGKIISTLSSCTPELGVTPPVGAECPVVEPAGADMPIIVAPTQANKGAGIVNYEIKVPDLGNGAKTEVTLKSRSSLLAQMTVGSKVTSKGGEPQWSFKGTATEEGKLSYTTENIGFKLSPSAHLGNKVCTTLIVAETVSKNEMNLEDDYTDRECSTVTNPPRHNQLQALIFTYYTSIYPNSTPELRYNNITDMVKPHFFSANSVCDPTNPYDVLGSTLSIVDEPSAVTETSCVKGSNGKYEFTRIPRKRMPYPQEQNVSYAKLLEQLAGVLSNSVGLVDDQEGLPTSSELTPTGVEEHFLRGRTVVGAKQLRDLKINFNNSRQPVQPAWYK